jgi:predicted nucleic acid-binding protein
MTSASDTPKRILIDSMIVDRIADASDSLGLVEKLQRAVANGALTIVETHILHYQLTATRWETRRTLLLRSYDALPKIAAPIDGVVLTVSILDKAELGGENLEDLATAGRGRWQDALLAATASGKADVRVTYDKDLQRKVRAKNPPCELWDFDEFQRFTEEQTKGNPHEG